MNRENLPIVVSCPGTSTGDRMLAMINAIYVARFFDLPFKFVWPVFDENHHFMKIGEGFRGDGKDTIIGISINASEKVFSKEFREKYEISGLDGESCFWGAFSCRSIQEYKDEFYNNPPYRYIQMGIGPLEWQIRDLDIKHYYKTMPLIFKEITFSQSINIMIAKAEEAATKLGDFVAFHIRGGDAIQGYAQDRCWHEMNIHHGVYYELVLAYMENHPDEKILLVGDNLSQLRLFAKSLDREVVLSNDLIGENYSNLELWFFDVVLMSKAKKIYSGHSAVARTACWISGIPVFHYNFGMTLEQQYFFLEKYKKQCEILNPFIKAHACFYRFVLSRNLHYPLEVRIAHLKEALSYDKENDKFHINIIHQYLKFNCIVEAEQYLSSVLKEREEKFFKVLFAEYWIGPAFKNLFEEFFAKTSFAFKNLTFMALKIAQYLKDEEKIKLFEIMSKQEYGENLISYQSHIVPLQGAIKLVKSHLAYKLGACMIRNSKSLLGCIKMPYLLVAIKWAHAEERKNFINITPLQDYIDYEEALKVKEFLSYKLGEALIKAYKNMWKGGLIKFVFKEVWEIRRDFMEKKANR